MAKGFLGTRSRSISLKTQRDRALGYSKIIVFLPLTNTRFSL
ncbi:hypothetical protein [Halothece sp. PCC 7418]|nr:hypothetical protein [Halothece sp. PCC 7418]